MRVLILGSTGRIGTLTLEGALSRGHEATVLVRDPGRVEPRNSLSVVAGDVRDETAVRAAVRGVDAVIAALGPRSNTPAEEEGLALGMHNLVAAMVGGRVPRLVALSGAGVDVPGDRKPVLDRMMSGVVRRFARHIVGAKQREFETFAASELEWTALRPPLVTDGSARGYRLDLSLQPGARVTRADVAQALVDLLVDRAFIRAAPFVLPARK
ncbi:MAG: NAD(P)H-binding protein [Chloroflexota bacterium]|nr:NAD(P)H-binding protein [Chloroflexota bacterium]